MFNCCMTNYNMFMGGCCGNNIMNTMFKMQMFRMIMNNIFHPYQQTQPQIMPQMPVMPMIPQPVMPMYQPAYPSIFPMVQNPSVNFNNNYYNDNSYQGPSLIDIFKDAYNTVFKKKTKKDEEVESDKSVESDEIDESVKSDESEKTNKSDKTKKSDEVEKLEKKEKSEKTNITNKTNKSEKKDEKKNVKVNNSKKIVISKSEITDIVHKKAEKYGVDEKLILAMINQESGFKNGQTSKKGAKGLMQLMPATAKELGPNDPEQNIDAGIRYMKKLLDMYNGDVKKALAAYNSGMGNVNDILNGTNKCGNNPNHIKDLSGIPHIKETQNYVKNIFNSYKNYSIA